MWVRMVSQASLGEKRRFEKRDLCCHARFRGENLCDNGVRAGSVHLSLVVAVTIEPGCVH